MEIIFLIVGISIGVTAAWFIAKFKFQADKEPEKEELNREIESLSIDKRVGEEKINSLSDTLNALRKETEQKEFQIIDLTGELSTTTANYKNLDERLQEQKGEMQKLQEKFNTEFKNLANEILEEKTQKFTEQNKTNLDEILKPLHQKIKDFEKRVEETYDKESKQRFSLKEEVKRLAELNQQISKEANNLTNALKGQAKAQGNWGEIILENILEKSGLVKDREYFVQASYINNEGRRLQPDVVIAYPGDRNVVVDSKVSLVAYERYVSAENKDAQDHALKEHIVSIKSHINDLSSKNYQDLHDIKSLDFVMMFLPVEPAYLIAIQHDSELWNYAYDRRILLISPTNLIAALKMVASLWQQEYQNKNVMEIARQSGALYDKFEGLVNDLIEIGKKLDSTQTVYKNSMNKLTSGKGNLLSRVENIKSLGAKTKKSLPQNLLDRIEEN